MARLVEANHWIFFDVLARNEAAGAHDSQLPHLLHCRAAASGRSAEETRDALDATLEALASLAGPELRARIVFTDTPAQQDRAAAA
jgi:plasmid stability protein